eukprot:797804_1
MDTSSAQETKEQMEELVSGSITSSHIVSTSEDDNSTATYLFDREFIIGIGNDNFVSDKLSKSWHYDFVMENDYNLQKYYALNRQPSQLQFYFDEEDLQREDDTSQCLLLTGIKIDDHIFVGSSANTSNISAIPLFTYFKSIELQYFYMRTSKALFVFRSSHYLCGINYIKFVVQRIEKGMVVFMVLLVLFVGVEGVLIY